MSMHISSTPPRNSCTMEGLQNTMIRSTTTILFSPDLSPILAYKTVTMQIDSTKVDCTIGGEKDPT